MRIRLGTYAFVAIFMASVLSPQFAYADKSNWIEFLFPSLKKEGPDPAQTLQAPFADPDAVVVDDAHEGLPENATPIHLSHRSDAAISEWVRKVIPDLLSYDADTYKKQYKVKSESFDKAGNAEYVKFLQDQNIIKSLSTGKYDVRCFVRDVPILMNEGPVGGRYRWLFQAKVMLSFIPKGLSDYKTVKDSDTITQEMVINLQAGRVPDVENEHGLLIEAWDGKILRTRE